MITIPSFSWKLSSFNEASTIKYHFGLHAIKIAHVLGTIALFLQAQPVRCNGIENPYATGDQTSGDNYLNVGQGWTKSHPNNEVSADKAQDLDYYNVGQGYFDNRRHELMKSSNMKGATDAMPPFKPGGLPLMSDGAFSLVVMIYVSIAFLFVFFMFCWNNHYPRGDPKGSPSGQGKPTCPLMKMEVKVDGITSDEANVNQIVDMYEIINKEKKNR